MADVQITLSLPVLKVGSSPPFIICPTAPRGGAAMSSAQPVFKTLVEGAARRPYVNKKKRPRFSG